MAGLLRFVLLALALKTNSVSSALVKRASGVTSSAAAANGQTFDYIVVGAGLAGTTVAARLAEDSSVSVLLIEAGADNRNDPRVYDIRELVQSHWKPSVAYLRCANRHSHSVAFPII